MLLNGRVSRCEELIELLRAKRNKRATDALRLISEQESEAFTLDMIREAGLLDSMKLLWH